ncbi:DUF86 domain-containing protein [Bradyrhizobium sp. KBS0727]|uniref:HepT-like ribonuclease domain-containing protein n=1 Tax=unclassified Bradyrhizobium TaxID=2631580 RepID=UPI00110DFD3A|nr:MULTISPECIES: HepT-like ribonuclease domain-containing protein [unclassified Bradyrhizobium]QDW36526.1 DUF86 domain-containing protein [Bradyrhizobium sp. KBS0725]QDW43126.1 DUF86 domain-containing protein [Bradyrhizobium sp. KBS0727]
MRSESAKGALYDIRDNILFARQFVDGLTSETFTASRLHVYAATRALEIISEASRRLPDDLRNRHRHLPWRSIRDVGNFYRHQYDNVAASYVWETVTAHLPPLLAAVLTEIEALER